MMLRIRDIGTNPAGAAVLDEPSGAMAAAAGVIFGAAPGATAGTDLTAPAALISRFSMWQSTSSLVMRPSEPLPTIWRRSRLFSRAMRRTSGEDRMRSEFMVGPRSADWEVSGGEAGEGGAAAPASIAGDAAAEA